MPALNIEAFGLWESDKDGMYNLNNDASDDDFLGGG